MKGLFKSTILNRMARAAKLSQTTLCQCECSMSLIFSILVGISLRAKAFMLLIYLNKAFTVSRVGKSSVLISVE